MTLKTTPIAVGLIAASLIALSGCVSIHATDTQMDMQASWAPDDADEIKIEAAIMDYFEGQGEGNLKRLDRAFNDNASMFGVRRNEDGESELRVWPKMSDVIVNWSKNPNPDAPARDGEIIDIDVVDGRIATALFRSTDRFYDALTLVKIDGQWEIASKVFVRQEGN